VAQTNFLGSSTISRELPLRYYRTDDTGALLGWVDASTGPVPEGGTMRWGRFSRGRIGAADVTVASGTTTCTILLRFFFGFWPGAAISVEWAARHRKNS
jgi:hypothetical protein